MFISCEFYVGKEVKGYFVISMIEFMGMKRGAIVDYLVIDDDAERLKMHSHAGAWERYMVTCTALVRVTFFKSSRSVRSSREQNK